MKKEITAAVAPGFADAEFTMQVMVSDEENGQYVPYTGAYTVYDKQDNKVRDGVIEEADEGKFVLKNGQYAELGDGIKETTWYTVAELAVNKYDSDYEFDLQDTGMVDDTGGSVDGTMGKSVPLQVGKNAVVAVQNEFTQKEKYMFVLQKDMKSGQSSNDSFTFEITNGKGELYVGDYYVRSIGDTDLPTPGKKTENGRIELEQGQEAVIVGVTSGSNIAVKESVPNGYNSTPSYTHGGNCKSVTPTAGGDYQIVIEHVNGNSKQTATVTCTNSYATGKLQITKNVVGLSDLGKLQETLQFKVVGIASNGKKVYDDTVIPTTDQWSNNSVTITLDVPVGTYTVTEEHYDVEGYTCEASDVTVEDIRVSSTSPGTANFTNTYTPANGKLQIKKALATGENPLGGGKDVFNFRVVNNATGETWYMHADLNGNPSADATVDGSEQYLYLPAGDYTITELDNLNYDMGRTTSSCNSKGNVNEDGEGATGNTVIEVTVPASSQQEDAPTVVDFTNTPRETKVPSDGSAVINGMKQESKDGPFTLYFEPKKGLGQKTPDNTDPSTPSN